METVEQIQQRWRRMAFGVVLAIPVTFAIAAPIMESGVEEAAKKYDRERLQNRKPSDLHPDRMRRMQERIDRLEQSQQKAKE